MSPSIISARSSRSLVCSSPCCGKPCCISQGLSSEACDSLTALHPLHAAARHPACVLPHFSPCHVLSASMEMLYGRYGTAQHLEVATPTGHGFHGGICILYDAFWRKPAVHGHGEAHAACRDRSSSGPDVSTPVWATAAGGATPPDPAAQATLRAWGRLLRGKIGEYTNGIKIVVTSCL